MQISPLCEGSAGFGVSREGADQSRCECAVLTLGECRVEGEQRGCRSVQM